MVRLPTEDICTSIILLTVQPQIVMWIIQWSDYLLRTSILQLFYCQSSLRLYCELFCGQATYWGHLYFNYSIVSPAWDCNVNYSVVRLPTEDICTPIILLSVQHEIVMWIICCQATNWGRLYFNYSIVSPASDCNVNYSVVRLPTEDICTSIILLSVQHEIVMWIILLSGYQLRTSVLQLFYCQSSMRL